MPLGFIEGYQMNLKPETKLQQDLNHYSFGGPPEIKMSIRLIIFIITIKRFVNYTRDTIKGIAEQLGPTSQMAWENRLALDMMLAEKGGVCIMIAVSYCKYIPNTTAPDGAITKALQELTTLFNKLAENSGISDSFKCFGR
jgi:hypothetical protein